MTALHGESGRRPADPTEELSHNHRFMITGARGFIGHHLVKRLASSGTQVHAISRRGPAEPAKLDDVTWWQLDLNDADATARLVRSVRPHVVFHLASLVTGARDLDVVLPTLHNNLVSTVNVLAATAAMTPQPRVVLAGSVEEPRPDDLHAIPSSPYAAAKWACSAYALMFRQLWNLPIVVLRIAMVYGPGQRDLTKLVPYVITSLQQRRAPQLTNGTREIDWIYVDDVVDACLATGSGDRAIGQVIDIGSGTAVSIRDTVALLTTIVASSTTPEFGALPQRQMDTRRICDPTAAKELLGWSASTDLSAGLAATVRWYRDHPDGE